VEKCRINIPSQRIDPEAWVDHVTALKSLKLIEEEPIVCSAQNPCFEVSCPEQQCVVTVRQQLRQPWSHPTASTASTMRINDLENGDFIKNIF
jgi:hypothetical protein